MSPSHQNPVIPFSVAILGIATFAVMDGFMKSLATDLGVYNAMLWRTMIGLLLAAALFLPTRKRWPSRAVLRIHIWRGLITSVMATLFFWGLIYVPLAEAIGLSFIAPLIALYLAAILLKEKIGREAVLASIIGFSGAMVIIAGKLGSDYSDSVAWGMLAILISALMYAYNLILQRQQALVAQPLEIAFFQNATVLSVFLLFAPFWAVAPDMASIPALSAAAAVGITSLMLLSWAYARAEARVLIPVEYTAFIWASLIGWLFFNESLTYSTVGGTALIVCGCVIATRQKAAPLAHVETTAI
jgi:S-adenosylmethionine uptake transporter